MDDNLLTRLQEIDKLTSDFKNAFGALSEEQLYWHPNDKGWSIGQNIQHLILINESYFPAFEEIENGNYRVPFTGRVPFLVNLSGNLLYKSVHPDNPRKMKTFTLWKPSHAEVKSDILNEFSAHQEKLKSWIQKLNDVSDETVISSPANKYVVYKLDRAFDILIAHERRHFNQAKRVLDQQLKA